MQWHKNCCCRESIRSTWIETCNAFCYRSLLSTQFFRQSQENLQSLPDNVHMRPTQTSCPEVFHMYLPFVCLVRMVLQCHEYLYVFSLSIAKPITKWRLSIDDRAFGFSQLDEIPIFFLHSINLNNMWVLESMTYYFATMRGVLDDADASPISVEDPWGRKDIRCWGDKMGIAKNE